MEVIIVKSVFRLHKKISKGLDIYANKDVVSVQKSTKNGKISINSNGRASVSLKTPIKGLNIKLSKKLFK